MLCNSTIWTLLNEFPVENSLNSLGRATGIYSIFSRVHENHCPWITTCVCTGSVKSPHIKLIRLQIIQKHSLHYERNTDNRDNYLKHYNYSQASLQACTSNTQTLRSINTVTIRNLISLEARMQVYKYPSKDRWYWSWITCTVHNEL